MSALLALIKKELIQTLRDRRMLFIVLMAPVIQLVIFGYVATTDVKNISLYVIDYDQSSLSRELAASFFASGYFLKVTKNDPFAKANTFLKNGWAKVVVTIPTDFSEKVSRNTKANLQLLIDGSDANSANITKSYLEEIIHAFSLKFITNQERSLNIDHQSLAIPVLTITPKIRVWYNPELKSAYYMVSGIICMILLIITALLTALAITKERELGTIEQILVSPLRRWEFVLGKTLPFVLVGFIEVIMILLVAKILFQIPMRGSLILLFFCVIIFLFTTLGLGLFAASVSKTQAQAMMTVFPIIMPAFLLSGLFFPIASIPPLLRWLAYINPLTYFLIIVRGILLKGNGFFDIYKEIITLAMFGTFFIVFSVLRVRKRIE